VTRTKAEIAAAAAAATTASQSITTTIINLVGEKEIPSWRQGNLLHHERAASMDLAHLQHPAVER
jgi:hypothetical protein